MIESVIVSAWILSPLIITSALPFGHALPRAIWLTLTTAILIVLWRHKTTINKIYSPLCAATLLFLSVIILSALFGIDPLTSFISSQSRTVGVGLIIIAFCSILPLADWIQTETNRRIFFILYATTAALTVIIAILQKIIPGFLITFSNARAGSTFGNALFFGAYCALSIFILAQAAHTATNHKDRFAYSTVSILMLAALFFLTGAKASIIACLIGLITAAAGYLLTKKKPRLLTNQFWFNIIVGLLPALIAGGLFLFAWFAPRFVANYTNYAPITLAERFINWDIARAAIKTRPLLGFGPETYEQSSDLFFDPRLTQFGFHETYIDKPHNAQLELALGSGFVGFASYLIFIGVVGWTLTRLYKHGQISVLELWLGVGFLITREIQNGLLFETQGSLIPFIIFLSYLYEKTRRLPQTKILKPPIIKIFKTVVLLFFLITTIYLIFVIIPIAQTPERAAKNSKQPYARESLQAIGDALLESSGQTNNAKKRAVLDALLGPRAAPRLIFFGAKYYAQLFLHTKNPADYSRAKELLNQTIKKMPARQEPYLIQAQLALANNDPATALTALTASESYGVYLGEFAWYKALALFALNQPDAAWPETQKALTLNFENYPQQQVIFVVNALQKSGQTAAAETVARALKLIQ